MQTIRQSGFIILFTILSISTLLFVSVNFWKPLAPNDYLIILIYLFLLTLINSTPLKVGDIYIMFTLAISIAIFLDYGIVVEAWSIQISTLVSSLISLQSRSIKRILLSQMMFIWISLVSGISYMLAGGIIGFTMSMVEDQLIPIIIYTFSFFLTNHILLHLLLRIVEQKKVPFLTEDMIWDAATLLFTLPLGLIMYLVKITYGLYGMLFVALLIVIITNFFKLYSELHNSHQQLKSLNKISASFTSELNFERTINALQQSIKELLTFDYSYIFLLNGDKLKLVSVEHFNGNIIEDENTKNFVLSIGEGLTGKVALSKRGQIVGSDTDIYQIEYEPDFIKDNKSLLSVPMVWHNQTVGVLTLGSANEFNFTKKDMTIANILASQAAIAIQNAKTYQKTEEKSLIDELTNVYNYRAFVELLEATVNQAELKDEPLSLLILDIDFFKQVNDRYGHLAGNEVLKKLASILKKYTRKEDVVARYGGEEYTIIIPNTNYERARIIAERIRNAIENSKIKIMANLSNNEEIEIKVTVSIGIATFPSMASSAKELIRNADRAMYVGSKQAGRNRVAVYSDL